MVVAVFDSGEIPVGVSERERRTIHVPCTDRVFYAADRAVIAVGRCAADDARRIRVDSAPRRTHRDGIGGRPNPIHRFDVERNRALQGIEPMHARRYAIARHRIDRRERDRQYVRPAPACTSAERSAGQSLAICRPARDVETGSDVTILCARASKAPRRRANAFGFALATGVDAVGVAPALDDGKSATASATSCATRAVVSRIMHGSHSDGKRKRCRIPKCPRLKPKAPQDRPDREALHDERERDDGEYRVDHFGSVRDGDGNGQRERERERAAHPR